MARKRFNFWLDDKRSDDWQVNELITRLKKPTKGHGQFTRAIREGLRLWASLRDHQTDVLLELFPWVRESLASVSPTPATDGGGQLDEIKGLLEMIASQQKPPGGYLMQSVLPVPQKPIAAPPVAEIKQSAAVSADDIASNFLNAFS